MSKAEKESLVVMIGIWACGIFAAVAVYAAPFVGNDIDEAAIRSSPPVRAAMELCRAQAVRCAVCGDKALCGPLQIHHVIPIAHRPDLAADQANLIALCPWCHFHVGHRGDYRKDNPKFNEDAELIQTILVSMEERR